jgi:hypothetical protein
MRYITHREMTGKWRSKFIFVTRLANITTTQQH